MLSESTYAELMTIARRSTCLEFCGVIVDNKIIEIRNVSTEPDHFTFNKKEWLTLLNSKVKIQAIWHTHTCGDLTPSSADIDTYHKLKYPSLIVSSRGYVWL